MSSPCGTLCKILQPSNIESCTKLCQHFEAKDGSGNHLWLEVNSKQISHLYLSISPQLFGGTFYKVPEQTTKLPIFGYGAKDLLLSRSPSIEDLVGIVPLFFDSTTKLMAVDPVISKSSAYSADVVPLNIVGGADPSNPYSLRLVTGPNWLSGPPTKKSRFPSWKIIIIVTGGVLLILIIIVMFIGFHRSSQEYKSLKALKTNLKLVEAPSSHHHK